MTAVLSRVDIPDLLTVARIEWVPCPYCPDGLMPGRLAGSCRKPACVACDIAADAMFDNN